MLKLYYADTRLIKDQQMFDAIFEKMHMQRREKILRCKNEEDKKCSLLVGYLLRIALEEAGYSYDELEFSQTEKGKPTLISAPEIFFSLSHSGTMAACVLADRQIGVDIENKCRLLLQTEKIEQLERIAEKCLTTAEKEIFFSCALSTKKECFLKFWTRKESYSKALGKGLGIAFQTIDTEKMDKQYWSDWAEDEYYISIYKEDADFSKLQIKKVISL